MFGSNILEAAIGVIFVYTLMSLLCTTINEQVIARFLQLRAQTLEEGIHNMLENPELVKELYDHPLIKGLSQYGTSDNPRRPSYIPANIFASALVSLEMVQTYKSSSNGTDSLLPKTLAVFIAKSHIDPAKELATIEKWYNQTMDRVSGWYKRKVQLIIFILGALITVSLNIDSLSLINGLMHNLTVQATLVSAAQGAASSSTPTNLAALLKGFGQIQPLIGWSSATLPGDFWGWAAKIIGLLITIFAVSLGAPFWFDVLNRLTNFRSSGAVPQARLLTATPTSLTPGNQAQGNSAPSGTSGQPVISTNRSTE